MENVEKYGRPKGPSELIGRIISSYDPGRCDTILPSGRWKADVEYDQNCEAYYIITGILRSRHNYILFGRMMDSYEDALRADVISSGKDFGHPFVIIKTKHLDTLMKNCWCYGSEMFPVYRDDGRRLAGYRPSDKLLVWDLFQGSPDDFVKLFEDNM